MPDYTDIFKETGEWSIESIFEINYKDDNAVRDWGSPLVAGGTALPTLISPYIWPNGTDNHDRGWGSARYVKKPTSAIPITTPAATPLAGMHKPCLTLTMRNTQAINCHTPHAIRTPASSLKNMLPSPATTKTRSQVRS